MNTHAQCGNQSMNDSGDMWYSLMPTICVNVDGTISGINPACRALFGPLSMGCRGRQLKFLENELAPGLSGSLFPIDGMIKKASYLKERQREAEFGIAFETSDLRVFVNECSFHSHQFGSAVLRVSEVPQVHTMRGTYVGSLVNIEVLTMDAIDAFREATIARIRHEIMWEVYAASYDRVLPELSFYREVVERHLRALSPREVQAVLDIGAGTGSVTIPLLRLGKHVTAVDSSRGMLRRLLEKVDDDSASRLCAIADSAERLPVLGDSTFDGVNVLLALFDMQDALAALNEAIRVLRPGGILIVTEPRQCFNVNHLMAAAEQILQESGQLDRLRVDWSRIQSIAPLIRDSIQNSQTAKTGVQAELVAEILRQSEFTEMSFRESHLGNCATIAGHKPSAQSSPEPCVLNVGENNCGT